MEPEPKQDPQQPKSFRKSYLESIKAATTPRPGAPLIGKINGDGWIFTPEDQEVYTDHMTITRPHKEEVFKVSQQETEGTFW